MSATRRLVVKSTGIKVDASRRHHADTPRHDGRHLWVALAMFAVSDPARQRQDLDMENLLSIEGPGCFHCEEPWRPDIGSRCPGESTEAAP